METEKNTYTIHSHIHQYAPDITVGLRRSLLIREAVRVLLLSQARLGSDIHGRRGSAPSLSATALRDEIHLG